MTLRSTWQRRRRLLGTTTAVVLGVAFLAGTLVLGDTLRAGALSAFATANAGTDVVVRGDTTHGREMGRQVANVDAGLADEVAAVDGVRTAVPEVEALAQLVGSDGRPVGGGGPPTLGVSWVEDETLTPYELTDGRAPEATGEVAIDGASAEAGDLAVGDTTTVRTPAPVEVTVVGVFDVAGGGAGGTTLTAFSLADAQRTLLDAPGAATRVRVAGDGEVAQADLAARIAEVLPAGAEAVTGEQVVDEAVEDLGSDILGAVELMLLTFAGIAVLVAAFSIHNTFTITVAQRVRESALLRALGATRRQVVTSVLVEAVLTGLVAAVLGVAAGTGLALGLRTLLAQVGLDLEGALVVSGRSVAIAAAVGIVVTVLASIVPAVKASRVPPLAALRDVAVDRTSASRVRQVVGVVLALAAAGATVAVTSAGDDALLVVGVAGVLSLVALVVLAPTLVRPVAALVGGAVERTRGVTGRLARRNVERDPRRTAATSTALLVGVGVVTVFTVVASSLSATIESTVDRVFGGDLVVMGGGFSGSGLSPQLAADLGELPEVDRAVGIGFVAAALDGDDTVLTVLDPAATDELLEVDVVAGALADVGAEQVAMDAAAADDAGYALGDEVELAFADGTTRPLTLAALYDAKPGDAFGTITVPEAAVADVASQLAHVQVLVDLADGTPFGDGRDAVEATVAPHGYPDVLDREAYAEAVAGDVDQALIVVYGLLALAIVIALMGIANTLALAIHERTRELGLLRAVGQTRAQLRAVVRWESVTVALFGTLLGAGLGVLIGWSFVRGLDTAEELGVFALPIVPMAVVIATGVVVGLLAAARPARRAARLDVLTAVAAE